MLNSGGNADSLSRAAQFDTFIPHLQPYQKSSGMLLHFLRTPALPILPPTDIRSLRIKSMVYHRQLTRFPNSNLGTFAEMTR
jgi:hypothetical protein